MTTDERWLTRKDAAKFLGVGQSTFRNLILDGRVRGARLYAKGRKYYDREALAKLKEPERKETLV